MTFTSAVRSLRDGQAAKPTSWRGYVKRENSSYGQGTAYDPNSGTGFSVGDKTVYNGSRYECVVAVTPDGETNKIGPFDSSKWTRIDFDHTLTFVENPGYTDTDSHSSYMTTVTVTASGVTYSNFNYDFVLDGVLFKSLLFDDTWEVAPTEQYQSASGSTGRW